MTLSLIAHGIKPVGLLVCCGSVGGMYCSGLLLAGGVVVMRCAMTRGDDARYSASL